MRYLGVLFVLLSAVACGSNDDSAQNGSTDQTDVAQQASKEAQEMVERSLNGENPRLETEGVEGCVIFDSGLVPEVFGVDASIVTYARSIPLRSVGHVLCTARWDKPNKAELEAGFNEAIQAWARTIGQGSRKAQPKYPKLVNEVSLTLVADTFGTAAEAVASLEGSVSTLTKGVSVNVGGKERKAQMDFGDWIEGVGDKAIFSQNGELMVAYDAKRFAVRAAVADDQAQDHEKTIELALRIIDAL